MFLSSLCGYILSVFSLFCISEEDPVTVTTDRDETELDITGLTPFTNYTLYVEGVTVEIGDSSADVMVMTLEDGEEVDGCGVYVYVYVYMCV